MSQTVSNRAVLRLVVSAPRKRPLICPAGYFWLAYFGSLALIVWWLL